MARLRSLLQVLPNVEIVGEAGNGREAVELVAQHHPDLVVMDITMKELNGLDATQRIRSEHPRTQIIILSMHDGEDFVARAFRAGAAGYLLKDSAEPELEFRSTREEFEASVRRGQEAIRDGDVFQVVLSQRLDLD